MDTAYAKNLETGTRVQQFQKTQINHISLVKKILSVFFIVVPITAGADKFFNILTDWTKYLHPLINDLSGISASLLMSIAGIVEIAAGILVLLNRRIGAYVVAAWLTAIALQLLAGWMYVDVAVRDLVMAAAALSLGLLSEEDK